MMALEKPLRLVHDATQATAMGKTLALVDAAKAAVTYEAERARIADKRDHMLSLVRNYLRPDEQRMSIALGSVTIRRYRQFIAVCECHRVQPEECSLFVEGCAVRFTRLEVEPRIWAAPTHGGAA